MSNLQLPINDAVKTAVLTHNLQPSEAAALTSILWSDASVKKRKQVPSAEKVVAFVAHVKAVNVELEDIASIRKQQGNLRDPNKQGSGTMLRDMELDKPEALLKEYEIRKGFQKAHGSSIEGAVTKKKWDENKFLASTDKENLRYVEISAESKETGPSLKDLPKPVAPVASKEGKVVALPPGQIASMAVNTILTKEVVQKLNPAHLPVKVAEPAGRSFNSKAEKDAFMGNQLVGKFKSELNTLFSKMIKQEQGHNRHLTGSDLVTLFTAADTNKDVGEAFEVLKTSFTQVEGKNVNLTTLPFKARIAKIAKERDQAVQL